ncbi:hypothetical protein [Pantoea sp. SOD02]|uniref:hypothetical protein n=1 Tax=Pantoea sp. SOD02 TaxID=2970818 RepID=UPI002157290B|nr:hypothetical protein [Pantoea sp. SOD02]UVC31404.1 hypothetical protein NR302_12885 [Pantoea sp. SOD02]
MMQFIVRRGVQCCHKEYFSVAVEATKFSIKAGVTPRIRQFGWQRLNARNRHITDFSRIAALFQNFPGMCQPKLE